MPVEDSSLRKLTRNIAGSANALSMIAHRDLGLKKIHNELCDVLDSLNVELDEERNGALPVTWRRL